MKGIVYILIAALLLICFGGIGVWLAKIISIKEILGIALNLWLILLGLGSLIIFGRMGFYMERFFEESDYDIMLWLFTPLINGWLFLNMIIPNVFMYDIKPSIPLQKFHYVDSNIIQVLDSNFGKIIHFSVYCLSAIPFMILIAFLFAYLRDFLKSKTPIEEKSQIPKIKNGKYEELSLVMIIFSFFYFVTNFTYPTLVFLLNK